MNKHQYNLYQSSIFLFLLCILAAIISPKVFADNQIGSSNKSKNIIGHPPFMQSVGAYLSLSNQTLYDENELPVLTVGSELFIPSLFCETSGLEAEFSTVGFSSTTQSDNLDNRFFVFADQDNDRCLSENHESQLAWFVLDSGFQEWSSIQSWNDLSATLLNDDKHLIPAGTSPHSPYTHGLRVPESAIGKRIGFIYSPISTTGNPNMGNQIKVWDIGYYFGQEHYDSAGMPTEENTGKRLEPITVNANLGKVFEMVSQPKIENLIMKGTFLPNFKLTAEYDFIANSENESEDVSRFWWGEAGTTESKASFQNPEYLTTNQSPVLTTDDVAKVYSVSVLPIKKEFRHDANYYIVGNVVSVTSDDPNNQFMQPSNIKNLQFTNALNIETTVSATYEFEKGEPNSEDHSEYTWSYIDTAGKSHILATGKITESGKVPDSPKLTLEQSGLSLKLEVLPKTQFNIIGEQASISSNIETAQFIAEPNTVTIRLNDTTATAVSVTAKYAAGSKDITLMGNWVSNNTSVATVDDQGNVRINPNLTTETTGSVSFSYLGRSITINVIVEARPPSISNLRLVSLLANNELPIFGNSGARYDYDDGGKANVLDKSTYEWRIKNEGTIIGSGTATNMGVIPFPTSTSPIYYAGEMIELVVTPRDNFNRTGEPKTVEAKLEEIIGVEVSPSYIRLSKNSMTQMNVFAVFSGTRAKLTPSGDPKYDGVWKVVTPGISVDYTGFVIAGSQPANGTLIYTYREFTVEIPFQVLQ